MDPAYSSVKELEENRHRASQLFRLSLAKQQKFAAIARVLGNTTGLSCLDLGVDVGILSMQLRQHGGNWKTADSNVVALRNLLVEDTYVLGATIPFRDAEFDRIVIVDYLEHVENDRSFIKEIRRILKPEGRLIINVPHAIPSILNNLRNVLGQTDERHGHVRPGYTLTSLEQLLTGEFKITDSYLYSGFFAQLIEIGTACAMNMRKNRSTDLGSSTDTNTHKFQILLTAYSILFPALYLISKLDAIFAQMRYRLVVSAVTTSNPNPEISRDT